MTAVQRRVLRLTVAAFVLYGAWAAVANRDHGVVVAARAGLVQACSSATTTVIITGGIEGLLARLRAWRGGLLWAALLPPTASSLVHVLVHVVNQTPELARAIAPSVVLGYAFAVLYVLNARRAPGGVVEQRDEKRSSNRAILRR